MGFRENLKSELQYSGMLVKELAARSGVKKKTLDSYLGTKCFKPSIESAVKIAKALDVTVEYLINDIDSKVNHHISTLPADLQEIMHIYKQLSDKDRKMILKIIRLFNK